MRLKGKGRENQARTLDGHHILVGDKHEAGGSITGGIMLEVICIEDGGEEFVAR